MAYAVNRLYRIITRLLGWLVGAVASVLAIFLLFFAVYILFFDYPAHIKNWMEDEASRILNREIRIESFSVNLPNSFELRGLSALPRESGPPWLEFDRLRGELKLSGLLQRQVELSLLQVDGLTLRVQDYGGGQVDLPGLWGPPVSRPSVTAEASFTFLANNIRFEDASFVYNNQNLPWYLEATDLVAHLERDDERRGYRGRLSYEHGELKIKERPSFEGALNAQFELADKDLRIVDVQAKGPFYSVQAAGNVSLGAEPQARIHLELESRVTPAARSLLGLEQLEDDGPTPARFTGELSMGRGWHQIQGQAEIAAARFAGLHLRNWKGNIYWDRSLLEVTSARGALAGGASELQIRQPLPVDEHPTRVTLELQDVPLQALVRARMAEPGPLASNVSGIVSLDLPTDPAQVLRGEFDLTGNAPDMLAQTETGIEFSVRGELDRGGVQIGPSRFVSDVAVAELSGSYSWSESVDLNLDLTLRDIARADQIQQVIRALLHPERPARLLGLTGSGRAAGRLTGRLPRLVFEGDFQGAGVSFRTAAFGGVEARGSWSTDTIRFESFEARKGDAVLSGTGELALEAEALSDWAVEGEVHEWPATELFELLRIPVPLKGKLSAKGRYSSHNGRRSGEGRVRVGTSSLYGIGLDGAEAGVTLQGRQITLDPLSMNRHHAVVEGRLRFDGENGGIEGGLATKRFPIDAFSPESMVFTGEMQAGLELAGTLEQPEAVLEAVVNSFGIGETVMGEARFEARIDGGAATANLSIQGEALALQTESRTLLSAGYPTEGELRWRGADFGPWLHALPAGLPGSLRLVSDGDASFTGQISSFESWAGEAVMENIRLEVGGYHLTSSNPVKAYLRRGTVQIDDLRLAGEDTQVTFSGSLPLEEGDLDLVAKGSVNLDILEGIYPSVSSSGQVELSARVRGDWGHPSLSGYADLSSGVLRVQGFPQALGDIRGRVSFDNRTIRFPNMRAQFGGAPVTVSGTLLLRGLSPDSFELGFMGQGLRLRYPEGLVATLDTDLRMSGTPQSQILSGRIDVSEATWSREYDLATGILVSRGTEGLDLLEEMDEETPLSNLRLDVQVLMPGTLRLRNSRASVDARAELQLRGMFTQPALLGRVEAVRGELFLLGQRYKLVTGRVEFLDPSAIKPFFDLVAESRVRSYRVELRLNGTPDRFFPELSSDPPLRTVDILRLMAGASERDILIGSEEEEIAGVGVASLLAERLTQEVGRRAERLFGLDRFSIDPFLVGQFANPTARVSIGKQIYRDLSVSYSTNLNAATETLILVEYTPEGPISWIISRDEEGAYGVDLRFRKSF